MGSRRVATQVGDPDSSVAMQRAPERMTRKDACEIPILVKTYKADLPLMGNVEKVFSALNP